MSVNSFSDNESNTSNLSDDNLSEDELDSNQIKDKHSDKKLLPDDNLTLNKSNTTNSNQEQQLYDDDDDIINDVEDDNEIHNDDDDDDDIYNEKNEPNQTNINSINNGLDTDNNSLNNKKNYINYKNNIDFLFEDVDIEKFNNEYKNNVLSSHHNECLAISKDEVDKLIIVHKNSDNIIIDEFHKTVPILTKYEKTKLLGLRVVQLNNNSKPYISANENMSNIEIANKEIELKLIPLIIKRPLSNNKFEYWKLKDLEIL
jgi:DNA-directed RNA polymerase subunit K/omega